MQAVDSLSRIISESESKQIKRLLNSITVLAESNLDIGLLT